jgi:transposase
MIKGWPRRSGVLDPYHGYLLRRWNEGQHSVTVLHRELAARGFTGSYGIVRDFLAPLRRGLRPPEAHTDIPSVPQVVRWLTRHPDAATEEERLHLKRLLAACPELAATHAHVHTFAAMLTGGTAAGLIDWLAQVRTSGLPALPGFATGLTEDLDAVTAGLSTPYSSGVVEGRVTDAKLLKRQMGGRAGIPLLRKRILLVAASRRPPRPDPTLDSLWLTNP